MINRETNRLLLRMFTLNDLDDLAVIFAKPNVMQYLGLKGEPMSREETEIALNSIIKSWDENGFGRWAVISKESGNLIGCAGFRAYEEIAELFYVIDEPFWGRGLASEIARECLEFAFENGRFTKIVAFTRPENTVSRRVLEKIRMQLIGEITVFGVFAVHYEITPKEYARRQN